MSSRFVSAGGAEVNAPEGLSQATDDAWEKARRQVEQARKPHENTGPAPGTQEGGKTLYEHLQAQKAAKQETFEEATKLRNQFRPLDDAEVEFLEGIKQKERNEAANVRKGTAEQIDAFRKERAAAEQLAQEQALKKNDQLEDAEKARSGQWAASRKRRRAASGGKPEAMKAPKTSPTPTKDKTSTVGSEKNHVADTAAQPPHLNAEAPAASGLVGYDSDSDS